MLPKPGQAQARPKLVSLSLVLSGHLPPPTLPAPIQVLAPKLTHSRRESPRSPRSCPRSPFNALGCAAMAATTAAGDRGSYGATG